ncbi:two-component system sensor histidine kinase NtrB [Paraburkholderia sp. SOS3]|jgi:two-component system sensor kinase FixL|uniref:two-component system sensor histidine kinase NtrB n=1 Tax=Paraburkholderia sp. SOS3 TaxID=1926494 RepID=UPI0009F9AF35|nr:ATP-binding protein [Paraburkholderia sp. SOS3]
MNIAIFAVANAVSRLSRFLGSLLFSTRAGSLYPSAPARTGIALDRTASFIHLSSITRLEREPRAGAGSGARRVMQRTRRFAGAWRAVFQRASRSAAPDLRDSFAALEQAPVAAIVVDGEGRILRANAQAERLFQYRRSDLAGLAADLLVPHLLDAAHARTDPPHTAMPACTQPAVVAREMRAKRRDGSEFPVEVASGTLRYGSHSAMLAFVTDRTERYELRRDRQQLAHLTRVSTLGELAGSLAHELNQPLTAILSNVQAAQRFIDLDPPELIEVREILKDIVDDSCRASEVIRRIRAFVKKDELQFVRLDPGDVLRDVAQLVHSDAIGRGVRLSVDIDDDLPPVRGDRIQLQQVVLNLMINAFDAMRGCDALERAVSAFAGIDRDGNVRIAIRDRGEGIAADRLERIFKPFVTSKPQGLGLGLSISRSIVDMHRGRLWAENNSDRGMTFYVVLPPWSGPETARQS